VVVTEHVAVGALEERLSRLDPNLQTLVLVVGRDQEARRYGLPAPRYVLEPLVRSLVDRMGIPQNVHGWGQLQDAVLLACTWERHTWSMGEVYRSVARSHATSTIAVERSIRHAIQTASARHPEDFHAIAGDMRPTNSRMVYRLWELVENDLQVNGWVPRGDEV